MVTARSSRTPRVRTSAGLAHLLGLALLLIGLLCAHGAGSQGAAHATAPASPAHASTIPGSAVPGSAVPVPGSAVPAAPSGTTTPVSAAPADRHDPSHPVHGCTPLPPRAGSPADATAAPPPAAVARAVLAAHRDGARHDGAVRHQAGAAPPAHSRASAVLQV
ncbi:hypothetical protein ACFY7H_03060 [Streptomyces sp. NPDC012794]|uniref:hypothetical protein n=1 Tax=Streptomyces sp. NPDC012794 TaxID=3364850 RepID=UPI0036CF1431